MTFDYRRTAVYTANTSTDSVSANTSRTARRRVLRRAPPTICAAAGSAPIGISFQYFGTTYTQDYVVNSGTRTASCPGTGSLRSDCSAIVGVDGNRLLGTGTAPAKPVYAWIYKDQSKVFVLDKPWTRFTW